MKIYVACLAAYNSGILHGVWIDLVGKNTDEIHEAIAEMLSKSPQPGAEEWAVHDYEEISSEWGEHPDIDALLTYVNTYGEHGEAWLAYVDCVGVHYATAEGFQDSYMGEYQSPADWAEEYLKDSGLLESVPESLQPYIDFENYARDAELGGDLSFVERDGLIYVFHNS